MNLLYKLLPDFLKKRFYPEIYFEPESFELMIPSAQIKKYRKEPCRGTLEIGNHCRGCRFEKEHIS